jgi:hypothetical protein
MLDSGVSRIARTSRWENVPAGGKRSMTRPSIRVSSGQRSQGTEVSERQRLINEGERAINEISMDSSLRRGLADGRLRERRRSGRNGIGFIEQFGHLRQQFRVVWHDLWNEHQHRHEHWDSREHDQFNVRQQQLRHERVERIRFQHAGNVRQWLHRHGHGHQHGPISDSSPCRTQAQGSTLRLFPICAGHWPLFVSVRPMAKGTIV